MGGYAIHVNRFLSLTLSLIISVTSACVPTPFLPLRLGSHALLRPFPLVCPPCPALSSVWLVAGDGQHMARSSDRGCPVKSTEPFMRRRRCTRC